MTDEAESSTHGTIGPKSDYDQKWAAERLKKAMRGIGSDEKMIIKVLVSHDQLQRAEIIEKYKHIYGQDLVEDLKAELGGHFEDCVVALLKPPYDLLVQSINGSFRLVGSDPQTLTEILCCRNSEEIEGINWWYEKNFQETLAQDLGSNLSGDFKRLMVAMVSGARSEEQECDIEEAKEDAQALYDAGIGLKSGTHEKDFIYILSNRCYTQLSKILEEYEQIADEPLETSIEAEFSGDIKDGLIAIVKRVKDPYGFFAERLNASMRGLGTDDNALIRLIVSRSEIDLENIKTRFKEIYGNSLASDIKEDTNGDYRKLLLAIINNKLDA